MAIPTITPYSGGVANPDGSQTQTEFTQNMFEQLSYEAQLSSELNATVNATNATASDVTSNAAIAQNSADTAQAAANFEGEFNVGVTSAEKGKSYSYSGEVWLCLQNTVSTPSTSNAAWKLSIGEQYVTESQEDLLPLGAKLFKGDDGVYLKNGDTVPSGTTHVRVLVGGEATIVAMSPVASGAVDSLTESSATIGTTSVKFIPIGGALSIPTYGGSSLISSLDVVASEMGVSIVFDGGVYTLDSNLTLTSNAEVKDGSIIDTNGFDIFFEKDVIAGKYKIFDGSGLVQCNRGSILMAYSDWFGPAGDGYDIDPSLIDENAGTYVVNGNTYNIGEAPNDITYTDDTGALQKLCTLNAWKSVISDDGKIYMINQSGNNPYDNTRGGLLWRDKFNQELIISGTIKGIQDTNANTNVLRFYSNNRCKLRGKGKIVGDLMEHPDGTFEGGMGVYIANNHYCDFEDFTAQLCTGDGTFVTYPRIAGDYEQSNLNFRSIKTKYNRRTGHVIELGDIINHYDCSFDDNGVIRGVATFSGVDVEPLSFADTPIRYADQINFNNCTAHRNAGVGFRLEKVLNGDLQGCYADDNANGYAFIECGSGNRDNPDPNNRLYLFGGITGNGLHASRNTYSAIAGGITVASRALLSNLVLEGNRRDFTGFWVNSRFSDIYSRRAERFLAITGAVDTVFAGGQVQDLLGSPSDVNIPKLELDIYNERGIDNLTVRDIMFDIAAGQYSDDMRLNNILCQRWFTRVGSSARNVKFINNQIDPRHNYAETYRVESGATFIARSNDLDDLGLYRALQHDQVNDDSLTYGKGVVTTEGSTQTFGQAWAANTEYYVQQIIRTSDDKHYVVLTAGTSGSTEPTAETDYVVDGTVVFAHICNLATILEVDYA